MHIKQQKIDCVAFLRLHDPLFQKPNLIRRQEKKPDRKNYFERELENDQKCPILSKGAPNSGTY